MKKILLSGGALLGLSAVISKLFGFWRDRLLVDIFTESRTDLIFAAFRIPDFFYYLFVGATVSVIFIPRISQLKSTQEQKEYLSSFLWGVALVFGLLSFIGVISAPWLTPIFAGGFEINEQQQIAHLARYLFGSVFLLALSSIFMAFLQHRQKFWAISVAQIFYMGSICAGLYFWRDRFGLYTVGVAALAGSFLHFLVHTSAFFYYQGRLCFVWQKPKSAWRNFLQDFWRRVVNNSAFQINQSLDVLIASFLLAGAVTAFSIGSNLGHVLLSIVGFSVANSAFPRLTQYKTNPQKQKAVLFESLGWILLFTIPFSILCVLLSRFILNFFFQLEPGALEMAHTVFFWTVLSLPAACLVPLLSRLFFANDDTKTPLYISACALLIATALAAFLSLVLLEDQKAILGLALGNFTANYLSVILYSVLAYKNYFRKPEK